ncbi:MAG: hypothetical protein WC723_04385 [Candidatus Omnitrophota bacterium]
MLSGKAFQIALLVSLAAHGVILFKYPGIYHHPAREKEQKLEVSYIKKPQETRLEPKTKNPAKKEPFLKLPPRISAKKIIPPPFIDKESVFKKDDQAGRQDVNLGFPKPAFIRPDVIAIKKKITVPPIDLGNIDNPSYITYYQVVREKIKRAAYQNYSGTETGEVMISFIISEDGYLKEWRFIEDKSSLSVYLRKIALSSLKDASPFPNFPKELNYPQLSFNLVITFEIE